MIIDARKLGFAELNEKIRSTDEDCNHRLLWSEIYRGGDE